MTLAKQYVDSGAQWSLELSGGATLKNQILHFCKSIGYKLFLGLNGVHFCHIQDQDCFDFFGSIATVCVAFAAASKSLVKSKSNLTNYHWLYKMIGN